VLLDKEANLAKMEELATMAADRGATVALFPECCVTGYAIGESGSELCALAEVATGPLRGESVRRLEGVAARRGLWLLFGIPELESGTIYNSVLITDPGRGVVATHHKVHLWPGEEGIFAPGTGFGVRSVDGHSLGCLICYDFEFPEPARALALMGAEMLAVSTANMTPWGPYQDVFARSRAMENGAYVAVANCIGTAGDLSFVGGSTIVDPTGRVLCAGETQEGVFIAAIDRGLVEDARAKTGYLINRRPDAYSLLAQGEIPPPS
jgi:predicted amidohydrolase